MHLTQLLNTKHLSRLEIQEILDGARKFISATGLTKQTQTFLENRKIVLAFFEASTRTRISFELAIHKSGGWSAHFQTVGSSVEKGESVDETIATLLAMDFDGLVIRHRENGVIDRVQASTTVPVINAGEGTSSHPTQALLDASALLEKFGSLDGLTICVVGDIKHSRVARSNFDVFAKLGANLAYCCPDEFAPDQNEVQGFTRFSTVAEAMKECEIVNMLRIQNERIPDLTNFSLELYRQRYCITDMLAQQYSSVAIIHPGPVNVGVEMDANVLSCANCLVHRQVTHGVAVRMAVLESIFSKKT